MAMLARRPQLSRLKAGAALAVALLLTLPASGEEARPKAKGHLDVGCPGEAGVRPAHPPERKADPARGTVPARRDAPAADPVDYEREVWRHQGVG